MEMSARAIWCKSGQVRQTTLPRSGSRVRIPSPAPKNAAEN